MILRRAARGLGARPEIGDQVEGIGGADDAVLVEVAQAIRRTRVRARAEQVFQDAHVKIVHDTVAEALATFDT